MSQSIPQFIAHPIDFGTIQKLTKYVHSVFYGFHDARTVRLVFLLVVVAAAAVFLTKLVL